MNLEDILKSTGGLSALAKQLGLTEQQASTGTNALLPGLLDAFQKQGNNLNLESLPGKLDLGSLAGQFLGQAGNQQGGNMTELGNSILAQILGSKDDSRALAQQAAASSGLDIGQLKTMLPLLATLVAGVMGGKAAGGAGLQNMLQGQLGNMLGGALKKFF